MTKIQSDRTLRTVYNILVGQTSGPRAGWVSRESILFVARTHGSLSVVCIIKALNKLEDAREIEREGDYYRIIGNVERIPHPDEIVE